MPSSAPALLPGDARQLARLGEHLRRQRRQQGITAIAAAEAAGMSRVTLHRIERGEPSVTMGAWLAAASVLGLEIGWADPHAAPPPPTPSLPERIRLEDFPQLQKLAWQLHGVDELSPQDALSLYERNWRHVDRQALSARELSLIHALAATLGGGRLLV